MYHIHCMLFPDCATLASITGVSDVLCFDVTASNALTLTGGLGLNGDTDDEPVCDGLMWIVTGHRDGSNRLFKGKYTTFVTIKPWRV